MALFESYERRIDKINSVLNSYGIASIEEAEKITKDAGLNVYDQIKSIQPICFVHLCQSAEIIRVFIFRISSKSCTVNGVKSLIF